MTSFKQMLCGGIALLAVAACGSGSGKLEVRSIATPLAAGQQDAAFRVAEGRSYFALNNVGLALEAFRKALRDDPQSVDALNGIAACYDRMGRFDLSRRHYEAALALDPTDARLYANLSTSLEMQGRSEEAASVRIEMAQRLAAMEATPVASAEEVPPTAVAAAAISVIKTEVPAAAAPVALAAPSITVPMAAPRLPEPPKAMPAPVMAAASITVPLKAAQTARPTMVAGGPRLQRLSSGQVALVTRDAGPQWKPLAGNPSRMTASSALKKVPAPIVLLNAARSQGLAARTRMVLAKSGFRQMEIGDAPRVLTRSVILYPAGRRAQAERLAAQFGFGLRHGPSTADRLTVILGRDAATSRRFGAHRA